jgi:hypothetical protein
MFLRSHEVGREAESVFALPPRPQVEERKYRPMKTYCETFNHWLYHPMDIAIICENRARRLPECRQCKGIEAPKIKATLERKSIHSPKGSFFVERYPHFGIIAKGGKRIKGKIPSFLSSKQFVCPKCGKPDYGNVDKERVVMCSLCVLDSVITLEQQEMKELKKGGKEDGREAESGSVDFREEFGRSIRGIQINTVSVQAKRIAVVKNRRKSLLSRIDIHGMGSP